MSINQRNSKLPLATRAQEPSGWLRLSLAAAAYVIAYVVLDYASYVDPIGGLGITAWNPSAGLSLFVLARFGRRFAPALAAAAIIADATVRFPHPSLPASISSAILIAGGYTLAASILVGKRRRDWRLDNLIEVNRFLAVTVVVSTVASCVYVVVHVVGGPLDRSLALSAALQYWIGDVLGIVIVAPLLVAFWSHRRVVARAFRLETLTQLGTIAAIALLVFVFSETDEFKFFYLLFLPVIWISIRHGVPGAVLGSVIVQIALMLASDGLLRQGIRLWELQLLLCVLSVCALYLGALTSERMLAERMRIAQQVRLGRVQQHAAVGEVAAGIAHEVNQPLAAAANYAQACQTMVRCGAPSGQIEETIAKANAEIRRAASVVRRIRMLFRSPAAGQHLLSLAEVFEEARACVVKRATENEVDIVIKSKSDLPPIMANRFQLDVVARNLIDNSIDALCESDRPSRLVSVTLSLGNRNSSSICCEVADNGRGLSAAVQEHIFDPFVTDKVNGMGFGLAICRSIVEAHGGTLELVSTSPQGTTFRLLLPIAA